MPVTEVEVKTLLRKQKYIDSWFVSQYGFNLYRGCMHDCSYCDGRAESYQVEGDFAKDIQVKINAAELLDKELNPFRKRKPLTKSFITISGGVTDCYQPLERKYELTRKALQVIEKWNFPVHVLTKSTLVERDLDILRRINQKARVIASFSLSTTDDKIARHFEPGVPSPTDRLSTLSRLKKEGIGAGVFLMPLIPLVSDTEEKITESLRNIKDAGADYVIFGGMTVKPGRQREHFYNIASAFDQSLIGKYKKIYLRDKWGSAVSKYYAYVHENFRKALMKVPVPIRIPASLFLDILNPEDFAQVMLAQTNYLYKHKGLERPFHKTYKKIGAILPNPEPTLFDEKFEIDISPHEKEFLTQVLNRKIPDIYLDNLQG